MPCPVPWATCLAGAADNYGRMLSLQAATDSKLHLLRFLRKRFRSMRMQARFGTAGAPAVTASSTAHDQDKASGSRSRSVSESALHIVWHADPAGISALCLHTPSDLQLPASCTTDIGGGGGSGNGAGGSGGGGSGDGFSGGDSVPGWDARRIWTLIYAVSLIGGYSHRCNISVSWVSAGAAIAPWTLARFPAI